MSESVQHAGVLTDIQNTVNKRTVNDDEISTSTRGLCKLYITLIARKLSEPDDDRYRPKHVVFYC